MPPRVAAIILAAGLSRRMAPRNKLLLADASGVPMAARVADAVLASRARPVVAVLGYQAELVAAALGERTVMTVHAADYASGLSASLRTGIGAMPEDAEAALVCLADMPLVTGAVIDRLIDAYTARGDRPIIVPVHGERRGNPVLWPRRFFNEMMGLSGDSGARSLLQRHANEVREIAVGDAAVLFDVDTPVEAREL